MILGLIAGFIPSPDQGVWHLFGVPIRAYALCIIAGVLAAVWLGNRRWVACHRVAPNEQGAKAG